MGEQCCLFEVVLDWGEGYQWPFLIDGVFGNGGMERCCWFAVDGFG